LFNQQSANNAKASKHLLYVYKFFKCKVASFLSSTGLASSPGILILPNGMVCFFGIEKTFLFALNHSCRNDMILMSSKHRKEGRQNER